MDAFTNRRILVVDDNPAIHADFRKILAGHAREAAGIDAAAEAFFGAGAAPAAAPAEQAADAAAESYEIDSALQGQDALERVRDARAGGRPYALAFVDVRMPPGWDGVETLARVFAEDGDIQAVLCTAFSDYSYEQTLARLGRGDRLLILKKPFDPIEAQQLASALASKWNSTQRERAQLAAVRRAEQEARAYAASLETVNRALSAGRATSDAFAAGNQEYLARLSARLLAVAGNAATPALAASLARVEAIARLASGLDRAVPEACDLDQLVERIAGELAAGAGGAAIQCSSAALGSGRSDARLVRQACAALADAARHAAADGCFGLRFSIANDPHAGRRLLVEATIPNARLSARDLAAAADPVALPLADPPAELAYPLALRSARAQNGSLRAEDLPGGGVRLCLEAEAGA